MSFTNHRRRDLTLVVGARAVSLLGDETATIALLLRLQHEGGTPASAAVLLIAALVPVVVLAPLVGRLVDRVDSRRLLVTSSLAQAALCTVLASVTAHGAVLGLVALLGVGQAVNGATWQSLLPHIAGSGGLPRAIAARVPLLVDAATFLVVTAAALAVATRRSPTAARGRTRERGGFAVIGADPVLRSMLTLLAVFITLGAMVNVVDVFLIRGTLGASATAYGAVGATWALGMIAGSTRAGRLRGTPALLRHTVVGACGLSAAVAAYAAAPSVVAILPFAAAGGAANGVLNVTTNATVMTRVREEVRGRVAAAVGAIVSASLIGAMALGGLVAAALTPRQVFLVAGLLGLGVALAYAPRLLKTAGSDTITTGGGDDLDPGRPADPVGSAGDGGHRAGVHA